MASKGISIILAIICSVIINRISADPTSCPSQESCESCLAADFDCAWCTDENYASTDRRCMTKTELLNRNCGSGSILQNVEETSILEDKELQDYTENGETIQIRPQRAKLRLVKGQKSEIEMTYRPARNNPLDLYYLMDLTFSMEDDRKTLVTVGSKLAQTLGSLTENYRLGYGSFSDKPIWPMIVPNTQDNPCKPAGVDCEPAYDFRHHLSFTNDMNKFVREVNESRITGNLDNLEGTLDALMQVIVCDDKIGWSEDARKIVIVATDGLMHFAGDGLLAGLIKKNDRKCHLSETGLYEAALDFDYPSLEEIYRELLRRKISVIFAVTRDNVQTYRQLTDLMADVSSVEILSEDSSNIVELVGEGYKKFVRKVNFVDTSPPFIDVSYKTDCGIAGGKLVPGQSCSNLELGQNVKFSIGFTVKEFPENGVYNHIIRIEEVGLSEALEVEVEIQKPCPCERNGGIESRNHELCNAHGSFECGMCYCEEGWIGKSCSCNSQSANQTDLTNQCRPLLEASTLKRGAICSDRGECECGQCYCFSGYEGQYCECPKCSNTCNLESAVCDCGVCLCNPGWSGPRCDCPTATDSCMSPNDELCSGQGECHCGQCKCNSKFYGTFCESSEGSDEFKNKICQYFNPCVERLVRERKDEKVDIMEVCADSNKMPFSYSFVESLQDNERVCIARVQFETGLSCDFPYIYDATKGSKQLYIVWDEEACKPVNYAAWISVSIIATILFGLLLIVIMKLFVMFQEKREFATFKEQIEKNQWEANVSPLYKDPVRSYRMPDNMDGTEFN
ncbi:unnamed protein product [Hermetia illucens]|uniref:Integrin beta n=1 Tax=Hermetia illucens TaxID=343691 RepID=A0A7R8UEC4_HERIL|nr:integrin beta-nu [Hermetia illucens]CAD7079228.1 unnamed protein product [Hermetia illucens]